MMHRTRTELRHDGGRCTKSLSRVLSCSPTVRTLLNGTLLTFRASKSRRLEHTRSIVVRSVSVPWGRFIGGLERDVDKLKEQFGDDFRHDYGWAAKALDRSRVSFADIEEAVRLDYMRPYYRAASEQVHASARGAILRAPS